MFKRAERLPTPTASRGGKFEVTEAQRAHVAKLEAGFKGVSEKDKQAVGLTQEARARYKLEVTFGPKRTSLGPNACVIQVWESGKRLHGGGDDLCFFCKDKGGRMGCGGVIPSDCIKNGVALCPSCHKAINANELTSSMRGFASTQTLALTLVKLFHQLEQSCDVYLKYHPTDIRYIAMEKSKGLQVARRLRGLHMYRLAAILKDTSTGADLTKRFVAFLTS